MADTYSVVPTPINISTPQLVNVTYNSTSFATKSYTLKTQGGTTLSTKTFNSIEMTKITNQSDYINSGYYVSHFLDSSDNLYKCDIVNMRIECYPYNSTTNSYSISPNFSYSIVGKVMIHPVCSNDQNIHYFIYGKQAGYFNILLKTVTIIYTTTNEGILKIDFYNGYIYTFEIGPSIGTRCTYKINTTSLSATLIITTTEKIFLCVGHDNNLYFGENNGVVNKYSTSGVYVSNFVTDNVKLPGIAFESGFMKYITNKNIYIGKHGSSFYTISTTGIITLIDTGGSQFNSCFYNKFTNKVLLNSGGDSWFLTISNTTLSITNVSSTSISKTDTFLRLYDSSGTAFGSNIPISTIYVGTKPTIQTITPGIGTLTVRHALITDANPAPFYFYNVCGGIFSNTTFNSNSQPIVIGNLTSNISCNIGLRGVSIAGNTENSYMSMAPYMIGNVPTILSIVPGLGNLTVNYRRSENYNPRPDYWYNVNGNTFTNSFFSGGGNTTIVIPVTSNISCNIGLRGVSTVGNTGNSYMTATPFMIGNIPTITSIVPGLGNLTVNYNRSENYNPPPYYWFSVCGGTFANSMYFAAGNTSILINNLTSNISCNIGLRGVSIVGNTGNSYMSMAPYRIGNVPTILSIIPGLGNLTVNYRRSENYNPVPTYYYNVSGNTFLQTPYSGAGNTGIVIPVSSNLSCNIGLMGVSDVGNTNISYSVSLPPYQIGTDPIITSIKPGLGNLTVNYTRSENYNPVPTYYYNVNNNTFTNSPYYGAGNTSIFLSGFTTATECNIGLKGVSFVGNTNTSYFTATPYIRGTSPSINSLTPGINSLSINFNKATGWFPDPYYYYSSDGGITFANSTYNSNLFPISINTPNPISYTIQLKGVSTEAGNTSVATATGIPYVLGTTPNVIVSPGPGKISVRYSQDVSGTYTTNWYYYLNDVSNSAPQSNPFDLSGAQITDTSPYSLYMVASNPAGDISCNTITGNVFGSNPTASLIPGINQTTVYYSQTVLGTIGTTYLYYFDGQTNPVPPENPFTLTNLTSTSPYSLYIIATNPAGDISSNPAYTVNVFGTKPNIDKIPGKGVITIQYSQDTAGTYPTNWYYYLNDISYSVPINTTNSFDISGAVLTSGSQYKIYIMARNPAGDISSNVLAGDLLGSVPTLSVTDGIGKITVQYLQSTVGTGTTYWYYYLNGTPYLAPQTNPFDISGALLTGTSPYSIYMLANNPAGDLSTNLVRGNVLGSKPSASLIPGINQLTVNYSQTILGTIGTTYSYYLDGEIQPVPEENPFTITNLTKTSPYSLYIIATNPAGDISSNAPYTGYVFGTTPAVTVDPSYGKISVAYSQTTAGTDNTSWYYYLNDVSNSAPASPFDLSGALLTGTSPYSIYMLVRNPAGDLSTNVVRGNVFGSVPTLSVTEGTGKITVQYLQDISGTTPTKWYYYLNDVSYSTLQTNPFDISGALLTGTSPYSIYMLANNPAGDLSTNLVRGNVFGSKPVIVSITPGSNRTTINYSQVTTGTANTTFYYYLNDVSYNAPASGFTISDLSSTNPYTFRISAVNPAGTIDSDSSYINVFGSKPTATVTPGIQKLTVSISQSSAGTSTTAYYYSDLSNGLPRKGTGAATFDISNITTTQTFYVVASNPAGYLVSDLSFIGTPYLVGTAPSGLSVSPINGSETSMRVVFTDSSGGYPSLDRYQYSLNSGSFTDISANNPLIITGLTPGSTYSVALKAVSGSAWTSPASSYSSAVRIYKIGSTPNILSVSPVDGTETSLRVYFDDSSGGYPGVQTYQYSTDGTNYYTASSTTSPITIVNLSAGTLYLVRLKALSGSAWTSAVSTAPLSISTNKRGSAPIVTLTPGSNQLTVNYLQNISGTSPTTFYYSLNNGTLTATPSNPFTLSGLTSTSPYSVYVLARNPGSDISSNLVIGNVFGSALSISLTPGTNKLSAVVNQVNFGTSPTTYYYSYYADGSSRIGPVTYPNFDISGLISPTPYTIYAVASNPAGNLVSAGASATPNVLGTAPPSIVSVLPGLNKLTVTFAGSSGGYPPPTYYYSYFASGSSPSGPVTSPFDISNISVLKTVYIVANYVAGNLVSSGQSGTPYLIGTTPTILAVTPAKNSLIVDFSGSVGGVPAVTTYLYSVDGGSYVDANTAVSPLTVLNLTKSQAYSIRIIASNLGGLTAASNAMEGTPQVNADQGVVTPPVFFAKTAFFNKTNFWKRTSFWAKR